MTAVYRDEAIKIGMDTATRFNKKKVKELTDAHRVSCGHAKATNFIVMDSPYAAVKKFGSTGLSPSNALYGQHDVNWLWFYKFFRDECGLVEQTKPLEFLIELCYEVNWMWMSSNTTVVCRRPVEIHTVNRQIPFTDVHGNETTFKGPILHAENGMALKYKDGKGIFKLNNIDFFDEESIKLIKTPAEDVQVEDVLAIRNTEQRTELLKKIGIDRAFSSVENEVLHTKKFDIGGQYQLLAVDFGDTQKKIYLSGKCPSKGEPFYERVPNKCKTVDQALQWRQDYALRKILGQELRDVNHQYIEPLKQS